MITRRTLTLNFFSWKSWRKLSITKILSIWIFVDRYVPMMQSYSRKALTPSKVGCFSYSPACFSSVSGHLQTRKSIIGGQFRHLTSAFLEPHACPESSPALHSTLSRKSSYHFSSWRGYVPPIPRQESRLTCAQQVHIVNNQDGTRRLGSRAYKICLAAISLYIGYLVLAAFGRVGEMDEKRSCHIGLKVSLYVSLMLQELIGSFQLWV